MSVQNENYPKALMKTRSLLLSTLPWLVQYFTCKPKHNKTTKPLALSVHLTTIRSYFPSYLITRHFLHVCSTFLTRHANSKPSAYSQLGVLFRGGISIKTFWLLQLKGSYFTIMKHLKKYHIKVNLDVIWDILQHPNPNKIGEILD